MNNKGNNKGGLGFLYDTIFGRIILKLLTARWISKLCGAFLNSPLSKPLIKKFIESAKINLEEYYSSDFKCFNDCFCRKIREENRPIDSNIGHLISTCDGLLSAYNITDSLVLPIKQSSYSVKSLLNGNEIYKKYQDGICLVFRLCVDHYHRYCYVDNGTKGENYFVAGKLHTVRPIALEKYSVFTENCREYTIMETENFGTVTQIEVGAMLVGKIKNHHGLYNFKKGEEKGMFLYGGSTIVLLLEKDKVNIDKKYFEATEKGQETPVRMGEKIGVKN